MTSKTEIQARIEQTADMLARLPIIVVPDRQHVLSKSPRVGYKVIQSDVTRMTSIGEDVLEAFKREFYPNDTAGTGTILKLLDGGRRGETLMFREGPYPATMAKAIEAFKATGLGRKPYLFFPFLVNMLADKLGRKDTPVYSIDFRTNRLVVFGEPEQKPRPAPPQQPAPPQPE